MRSAPSPVSRRRRAAAYALVGLGLALTYQEYRHGTLSKAGQSLKRWWATARQYGAALAAGADVLATVLADLRQFVQSERDDLPQSLLQLAKLAKSQEVAEAGAAWIRAACGQGAGAGSPGSSAEQPDLFERTLSALTAERSQSVIALAVSVACRSSVQTLVECTRQGPEQRPGQPEQPDSLHKLLRWAGTAEGERLLLKVVGTFSTQSVSQYMSSLDPNANVWADLIDAVSRPAHSATSEHFVRVAINEVIHSWAGHSPVSRPSAEATAEILRTASASASPPVASRMLRAAASCCLLDEDLPSSPVPRRSSKRALSVGVLHEGSPRQERDIDSACESAAADEGVRRHSLQLSSEAAGLQTDAPVVVAVKTNWMDSISQMVTRPEARTLILQMAPVVVAEAVRSSMVCSRDLLLGRLQQQGAPAVAVSGGSGLLQLQQLKVVLGLAALLLVMALVWHCQPRQWQAEPL